VTFDDTILTICHFRDTHPQYADWQLAIKPIGHDTLEVLLALDTGTQIESVVYHLGAPL
jgi:hypothetical protein